MTPRFVGIAGGTGAGKSTLAIELVKQNREHYALVHLDDYFKKSDDAPKAEGVTFWDHPEAIRFDDLYADLCALKRGEAVTVMTRSELYNPEYKKELKNKLRHVITPKPCIIVEGYLAFYDPRIRALMEARIYLDISIERSIERRTKFVDMVYFEKLLIPAHKEFVEPTKEYATLVIDVSNKSIPQVVAEAATHIKQCLT